MTMDMCRMDNDDSNHLSRSFVRPLLPVLGVFVMISATTKGFGQILLEWLELPAHSTVMSNDAILNLPNYGNVQVSWTTTSSVRAVHVADRAGSVGDVSWNDFRRFGIGSIYGNENPSGVESYTFDFDFLGAPTTAGDIYIMVQALAAPEYIDSASVGTTVTVNDLGIYLGDFTIEPDASFEPHTFTPLATGGTFSNDVLGSGNSDVGIYRLDTSLSSLTLDVEHGAFDGMGFTIGFGSAIPEPSVFFLNILGVSLLVFIRRRSSTFD